MSKIIIVNWKWDNHCPKEYYTEKRNKVIFLNFKKGHNIDETQEFFNKVIEFINSNEVLVCCHLNKPNNISSEELKNCGIDQTQLRQVNFHNFRGDGTIATPMYISKQGSGLLHNDFQEFEAYQLNVLNGKIIPEANFQSIWSIILEEQKKKLINLWLPLAIDIQGLSEVQSDTQKAEEYFNEIKNENEYLTSLLSFGKEEDFPRWQEIIEELMKEAKTKPYAEFNPISIVDELKKENQTFDSFKNNDAKYLENKNGDILNPNFLPNWLQEVVSVIDLKISENK